MNKEVVKKGYDAAQKDIEESQIERVKQIVRDTLTGIQKIDDKIDELKSKIKEYEDERKLLKLDIDDLKEGHLDRIEERQRKDKKAKKISVVLVEKQVHHHHYDRWHEPYKITYPNPSWPYQQPVVYCDSTSAGTPINAVFTTSEYNGNPCVTGTYFTLNNSTAKNHTSGTYKVGNAIVHLR
jgi:regulator of replication initiation timing